MFSRSHSNIATKKRQHVNLQTLVLEGRRVQACASCLRTQTKRLERATAKA